jgi:hypothetical protein
MAGRAFDFSRFERKVHPLLAKYPRPKQRPRLALRQMQVDELEVRMRETDRKLREQGF